MCESVMMLLTKTACQPLPLQEARQEITVSKEDRQRETRKRNRLREQLEQAAREGFSVTLDP